MPRTISQKMGIAPNTRAILINAPEASVKAIELPELDITTRLTGKFGYIHLFVITQAEFHKQFPKLKEHLDDSGRLWVSWPKSKQLDTDLTIKKVIELGYDYGLVESTCLSIDQTWSAIKFTWPKKGKVYNNSYGTLKT